MERTNRQRYAKLHLTKTYQKASGPRQASYLLYEVYLSFEFGSLMMARTVIDM